ncbi:MAG: YidC/Oxa1 family membrane protein insertase [bacterium]|nr:YidC/Oxa1 family membrane protein insertase [bacterium]
MFGFFVDGFNAILYYPLFNLLVLIYNYLPGHDFGIAIIVLTIIIRFILYPISVKALTSQKALQKLQPQLQELQKKYKEDKEKLAKETLELYRKEKINPFSGLFLALLQLPILIALYQVFWNGLKVGELNHLYAFVANPGQIDAFFLNLIDLSKPHLAFAIVAGVVQFFQTKMLVPSQPKGQGKAGDMAMMMQKQMVYFFPFITVVILLRLPSALGLYWIVSGLFSIIQQYFILKKYAN